MSENKKYEMLENDTITFEGKTLYRIRALKTFGGVIKGDIGGYIETERNLLHYDNAWIYDNAKVYGNARVHDNAWICDNARVYGNALIYDNALVYGNAKVYDNTKAYGNAKVYGNAKAYGSSEIYDNAHVCGNAEIQNEEINHRMFINSTFEDVRFFAFLKARDITALKVNGVWLFNIGCQKLITKKQFIEKIKSDGDVEEHPHRQNYLDILKLFEGENNMKEENKEIRYCYTVEENPNNLNYTVNIIPSDLSKPYLTKEECLEKANEWILKNCSGNKKNYYIHIFPIEKTVVNFDDGIAWDTIRAVERENYRYSTYNDRMYDEQQEELRDMIKEYINKHNDWHYVNIIKTDMEIYEVELLNNIVMKGIYNKE